MVWLKKSSKVWKFHYNVLQVGITVPITLFHCPIFELWSIGLTHLQGHHFSSFYLKTVFEQTFTLKFSTINTKVTTHSSTQAYEVWKCRKLSEKNLLKVSTFLYLSLLFVDSKAKCFFLRKEKIERQGKLKVKRWPLSLWILMPVFSTLYVISFQKLK